MKRLLVLLLFISFSLVGFAQINEKKSEQPPKSFKEFHKWDNNMFPKTPQYQFKPDTLEQNYYFKLPNSEKSFREQFMPNVFQNYNTSMPVAKLKYDNEYFNMPIAVPDSTVNYSMKIIRLGGYNYPVVKK